MQAVRYQFNDEDFAERISPFGPCYKAFDSKNKKTVMLYEIRKITKDIYCEENRERMKTYIDKNRKNLGQNIVNIYEFLEDYEASTYKESFIVADYYENNLESLIQIKKTFSEGEVMSFLFSMVKGIKEHLEIFGVAHSSITIKNIMVKGLKIKEGISAKNIKMESLDYLLGDLSLVFGKKGVSGANYYICPELLDLLLNNVSCEITEKCDVWSIGSIAYQLLTGKKPWKSENCFSLLERIKSIPLTFPDLGLSDKTKNLIRSMLTLDSSDRISLSDLEKKIVEFFSED